MSFKIRPLQDRVVIDLEKEEERKSDGGIILSAVAAEAKATQVGIVIWAGKGAFTKTGSRQEMELKIGDKVLLGTYSGSTVKINGQTFMVAKESDIMGVIEEGEGDE